MELSLPNEKLADHLFQIYKYYDLESDTYRAKSFLEASEKIRIYPDLITSGQEAKEKIGRGIGTSIMEVINEFIYTGTSNRFNNLKNKNVEREGVIELFKTLHGVGSVTANKFYDAGYRTFEDLWTKAKLTNAQKLSIYYREHLSQRIPRKEMDVINQSFRNLFPNIRFEIVGSYRRGESSSGDIDVLVQNTNGISIDTMVSTLKELDTISGDLAQGETKYLGLFHLPNANTRRLDISIIAQESWASALMHSTGSQRFNILMRQRAIDLNMRLNEYGLYQKVDTLDPSLNVEYRKLFTNSEEDIFNLLRVKYLTPAERTKDLVVLNTF